jgi:hypothetical protein
MDQIAIVVKNSPNDSCAKLQTNFKFEAILESGKVLGKGEL